MLHIFCQRIKIKSLTQGSLLTIIALSLLGTVGCNGTGAVDPPGTVSAPGGAFTVNELPLPEDDPADVLGFKLLDAVSVFGGTSFFLQPESDDYANIPQDPLNPMTPAKVALGKLLFNEVGLGGNNVRPEGHQTYTCATCHPNQSSYFSALPQAIAEGGSGFGVAGESRVGLSQYDSSPDQPDVQRLRAPSVINMAFQPLAMRDGRLGGVSFNVGTESRWNPGDGSDANALGHHGLETQAFAGLKEHRMEDVALSAVAGDSTYQAMFAAAFPGDPTVNRYNAAMAIAAFERTIMTNQAPFQRFLRGEKRAMTSQQIGGGLVFFGKGQCSICHTGPALNSMTFWAIGMNDLDGSADPGRVDLAPFSGTIPLNVRQGRGGFTGNVFEEYAFKVPQLYNLKDSNFFGHGSSFTTIRQVVEYYNAGVKQNVNVPQAKVTPLFHALGLTQQERDDLVAFLEGALYDPNLARFSPASTPLGMCYPANDPQSRIDLGCSGPTSTTTLEWIKRDPRYTH